jgi:hypothetical protein
MTYYSANTFSISILIGGFFLLGLGLELLKETICMCCPNMIIQLGDDMNASPNKMPDVTLEWLLQQPVFASYRVRCQLKSVSFDYLKYLSIKYK